MAATDGQIVVAAARWAEEATYLREFVSKYRLPAVIKITKGQYGGLGVPTLPAPSLQSTALLVSAGRRRKIVAQAVKIKEGRRVVGVGPRLAIPDSYAGYFEILSEEGRAVRGIESVNELCRRCPEEGALVRETVRGIACRVDDESGIVVPEGTRTLAAGETIVTAGEVSLPGRGRFLRCVDCRGESVLLGMEQRGRFSAVAREDNISGVHTARALLSKRLPLTVRLVHGQPPRGLKSSSQFVPELRLLSTFEEEHVFALPLQREGAAVALPLAAPLKLVKARNEEALRSMQEFTRLVERASRLVADVADRAHVLDGRLGESKQAARQTRSGSGFLRRSSASANSDNSGPLAAHHRSNAAAHHHHHHHHYHSNGSHQQQQQQPPPSSGYARDENRVPPSACTEEYDEIDQIYDYVRGFAPLPKSVRSPYESPQPAQGSSSPPLTPVTVTIAPLLDDRPEPPPIETIPTKKIQAEKRTRRAVKEAPQPRAEKPPLAKLYVKNSGTQRGRPLMRQKSASPLKETPPGYKGGSPLFNIRYKSLTNLQQAMELDGTLDSSHSGGRTSGDSGAGAKLPEKRYRSSFLPSLLALPPWKLKPFSLRSRRLSRPRSLTNLVWELRGGSGLGRPETPPPATAAPLPPTKCGPRLAVTVVAPRRVSTLYL